MTREEARKASEVMIAFANGAEIERYDDFKSEWEEVTNCTFDWFTYDYRVKPKGKFDPRTLKPFDKVIVSDESQKKWSIDFYSHKEECEEVIYPYVCCGVATDKVIPYNEGTKHLVGTSDNAPEYYRYWEE